MDGKTLRKIGFQLFSHRSILNLTVDAVPSVIGVGRYRFVQIPSLLIRCESSVMYSVVLSPENEASGSQEACAVARTLPEVLCQSRRLLEVSETVGDEPTLM